MRTAYTRGNIREKLQEVFNDPERLQESLKDTTLPSDLVDWLKGLSLLKGVPFNYLVGDEAMLPLESIRFFYLDNNWIDALIDGAFSIGRNLSDDESSSHEFSLDKAVRPLVMKQSSCESDKAMDTFDASPAQGTVSGFLLRSRLVNEYPHIGVNAFPEGKGPDSGNTHLLNILRLEKLSPSSDTLICLIEGDAHQIEVHEPAQVLHFGIDCFNDSCQVDGKSATAVKDIRSFTLTPSVNNGITTNAVNLTGNTVDTDISSCFRATSPRVIKMALLADLILTSNNNNNTPTAPAVLPTSINSAEMGFVMTEGVGMVSFINSEPRV